MDMIFIIEYVFFLSWIPKMGVSNEILIIQSLIIKNEEKENISVKMHLAVSNVKLG